MIDLPNARKLSAARNSGPWSYTFEDPDGFPCAFLDSAKTVDITNDDLNFIDYFGTFADQILDELEAARKVVEAVESALKFSSQSGNYSALDNGVREAIKSYHQARGTG